MNPLSIGLISTIFDFVNLQSLILDRFEKVSEIVTLVILPVL